VVLKGQKSRPINAVIENQPYIWNGEAYELQTSDMVYSWSTTVRWPE